MPRGCAASRRRPGRRRGQQRRMGGACSRPRPALAVTRSEARWPRAKSGLTSRTSPPVATGRLRAWLGTTDHKRIGVLYLCTTFAFFLIGGVEALLMRLQLALPGGKLLGPDA